MNNKIRYDGIYIQKGNLKKGIIHYVKLNENDSFSLGILPKKSNYEIKENLLRAKFEIKGLYKLKEDSIFLHHRLRSRQEWPPQFLPNWMDRTLKSSTQKIKLMIFVSCFK
jgi:hypothetical protein